VNTIILTNKMHSDNNAQALLFLRTLVAFVCKMQKKTTDI